MPDLHPERAGRSPAGTRRRPGRRRAGLLIVALIGFLSAPREIPGAPPAPPASGPSASAASAVPRGWLRLPGQAVAFDVEHAGLQPDARVHASELTLFLLRELQDAGLTVWFQPEFLDREIRYYEDHRDTERPRETCARLVASLRSARSAGTLDWATLDDIRAACPDPIALTSHFPWLHRFRAPERLGVKGPDQALAPSLHLAVRWESRAGTGTATRRDRRDRRVEPRVTIQTNRVWNFQANLRLGAGLATLFARDYPTAPWKPADPRRGMPAVAANTLLILEDVRTGLRR